MDVLLARDPRVEDVMNGIQALSRLPRRAYRDMRRTVALARRFVDEAVRPVYNEIDLAGFRDPDYIPENFIREAGRRGIFSRWIPKMFGGGGMDFISLYPFLEEIAATCTGLANVIGVHYLGVGTLCASWNIPVINRVLRESCRGDRMGTPCLISLAITEPEAGTDVEEPILLARARIGTTATRADGGYILNGRKVFISNGHVSTWHMVIAYADRKHPADTTVMAAVKTGTSGFSFGRKEKKMGQKACVASELVFEDCFVPDALICSAPEQHRKSGKPQGVIAQYLIDFVVSSSRAGVGAFAAGAARGAYETALAHCRRTRIGGELLINRQWAQVTLAEMYRNVNTARALYLESALANAMKGMYKLMYNRFIFTLLALLPRWYFTAFVAPFLNMRAATRLFRNIYFEKYTAEEAQVTSGWASLSKFACSDIAVQTASMAVDLMGADGTRHDTGAEKFYRDAKLLQIYEGTNQLNRLNLFKNLVARDIPEAELFKREGA
ncbi:MAG: acyl-CoA dehydrogenase [Spirochaetes bacterium]|nr:MAG: acyl-CoA dehydrogenase [Spirochaetota bacterium]